MTPRVLGWSPSRKSVMVLVALLLVSAGMLVSRAGAGDGGTHRASVHPRAPATSGSVTAVAGKTICPAVTPTYLPAGMTPHDRNLVPYSEIVLGIDATWADQSAARSIEILDGGYVDDITEPYDSLLPASGTRVQGNPVTVLSAVFLKRTVYLGYWRQPGVARPCDVHAVVTLGLTRSQAYRVIGSLG